MTDPSDDAALRAEFEAMAARAGLVIPPERDAVLFESFKDFRKMVTRLHGTRDHTREVAHVFSIAHVTRGGDEH